MISRDVVEEYIPENEQSHRFAHALLTPLGLYKLWRREELEGLDKRLDFVIKENIFIFRLEETTVFKPSLYYYKFIGIEAESGNKKKDKKS